MILLAVMFTLVTVATTAPHFGLDSLNGNILKPTDVGSVVADAPAVAVDTAISAALLKAQVDQAVIESAISGGGAIAGDGFAGPGIGEIAGAGSTVDRRSNVGTNGAFINERAGGTEGIAGVAEMAADTAVSAAVLKTQVDKAVIESVLSGAGTIAGDGQAGSSFDGVTTSGGAITGRSDLGINGVFAHGKTTGIEDITGFAERAADTAVSAAMLKAQVDQAIIDSVISGGGSITGVSGAGDVSGIYSGASGATVGRSVIGGNGATASSSLTGFNGVVNAEDVAGVAKAAADTAVSAAVFKAQVDKAIIESVLSGGGTITGGEVAGPNIGSLARDSSVTNDAIEGRSGKGSSGPVAGSSVTGVDSVVDVARAAADTAVSAAVLKTQVDNAVIESVLSSGGTITSGGVAESSIGSLAGTGSVTGITSDAIEGRSGIGASEPVAGSSVAGVDDVVVVARTAADTAVSAAVLKTQVDKAVVESVLSGGGDIAGSGIAGSSFGSVSGARGVTGVTSGAIEGRSATSASSDVAGVDDVVVVARSAADTAVSAAVLKTQVDKAVVESVLSGGGNIAGRSDVGVTGAIADSRVTGVGGVTDHSGVVDGVAGFTEVAVDSAVSAAVLKAELDKAVIDSVLSGGEAIASGGVAESSSSAFESRSEIGVSRVIAGSSSSSIGSVSGASGVVSDVASTGSITSVVDGRSEINDSDGIIEGLGGDGATTGGLFGGGGLIKRGGLFG